MKLFLFSNKRLGVLGGLGALVAASALFVAGLPAGKYTTHEWGTFTSVQGGDGASLDWRPLETSRLPGFVYDWKNPGLNRIYAGAGPFSKGGMLTLQRMETPVIYFYAEKEQTVDVSVHFPKGLITEWYPQARQIGPSTVPAPAPIITVDNVAHKLGAKPEFTFATLLRTPSATESRARWPRVHLLPARQRTDLDRSLPLDRSGSHYFSARETDAAFVQVDSLSSSNPGPDLEKFIFYRGVGSFTTPLRVTSSSLSPPSDQSRPIIAPAEATRRSSITLTNTGSEPLNHLFLLAVENQTSKFLYLDRLNRGEARTFQIDLLQNPRSVAETSADLSQRLTRSLVRAGLYPREAAAMVKTWRDSWFAEDGVRVLYLLPRAWTDQILPLHLEPRPRELVRVMVGRTEVITPAAQQKLAAVVARAVEGDLSAKAQALSQLRKLGRFAEPAMQLAMQNGSPALNETGWKLLHGAARPSGGTNHFE